MTEEKNDERTVKQKAYTLMWTVNRKNTWIILIFL